MEKPILKNEIQVEIKGTPVVTQNIAEVKEYALELKEYYSKLVFNDEQVKEAKDERISINKIKKQVEDHRKAIVSEYNQPLEEFVSIAKETEKILAETASSVDAQVKKYETKEKDKKKKECEDLFNSLIGDLENLVPFEKVFNDKWLNKTTKMSEVENDIKDLIKKVKDGMEAIKTLKSEFETELINTFLTDFDVNKAILKNQQLQEQKEALEKNKVIQKEIKREEIKEKLEKPVEAVEGEPTKSYILKITASYTKLVELKKFMDLNEIKYENVKGE